MARYKNFFEKQSDLTANKILIFKNYVEVFSIKLLMRYGEVFFGDLFCGCGKNGEHSGSPLVLVETVNKMISAEQLAKKHLNSKALLLFNDSDQQNIDKLASELKGLFIHSGIRILKPSCKTFCEIVTIIKKELKGTKFPKFFFLDPFGYSKVEIESLISLAELQNTEILLFLPVLDAYRFASYEKIPPGGKYFLENFTSEGVYDYPDIDHFNDSIKKKMKLYGIRYVRPVLLDGGRRKNALFLLTNHISGAMAMNSIAWRYSDDGKSITSYPKKNAGQLSLLFDPIKIFQEKLKNKLMTQGKMNNVEIIHFIADNDFIPQHADSILRKLKKTDQINVVYNPGYKTGFYIGSSGDNWCKVKCTVKYVGD